MTDFQLLETMRVTEQGSVPLLDRHLDRVRRSARYFSFKCDLEQLRDGIANAVRSEKGPLRLRLLLSRNGEYALDFAPLPSVNPSQLRLAALHANSENPFLYHKTTNREIYAEARRGCDAVTDVILQNERGEATETTIANIAVFREGQWITPPVSCGLLAGVMREELLETGAIVEGTVRADALVPGETIRCFNALRGIFDAALCR